MIASVSGRLEARGVNHVILSVGGVGFKVFVPTIHLDKWSRPGQEVTLHTYLYVRESELTLYGFADPDERGLFEMLISVSDVLVTLVKRSCGLSSLNISKKLNLFPNSLNICITTLLLPNYAVST